MSVEELVEREYENKKEKEKHRIIYVYGIMCEWKANRNSFLHFCKNNCNNDGFYSFCLFFLNECDKKIHEK